MCCQASSQSGYWDEVAELTQGIRKRKTYGTDMRVVAFYASEPSEDDSALDVGVRIEDGSDNEVLMPVGEFMPLAARWLGALRDGALQAGDPATTSTWWQDRTGNVLEIERSAAAA